MCVPAFHAAHVAARSVASSNTPLNPEEGAEATGKGILGLQYTPEKKIMAGNNVVYWDKKWEMPSSLEHNMPDIA